MKDLLRKLPSGVDSFVKFGEREKQLLWKLEDCKTAVHEALCGKYIIEPHPHPDMCTLKHFHDLL